MIDSHAHLTDERFHREVDEVLDRARAVGVEAVVTIGTDLDDSRRALEIASGHPDVYAAVGVHPHSAQAAAAAVPALPDLARHPRVVAIGETGLDYHYDFSPRDVQRVAFARQLALAAELQLPIVVHAREADDDLMAMLEEHGREVGGVLHCFSSGPALLELALSLGWYASFAGMITFKGYHQADLLRSVPLERLLVETDSPYLAPVPLRGRRNEPANVAMVVEKAAELRSENAATLAHVTAANARTFYGLVGGNGSRRPAD